MADTKEHYSAQDIIDSGWFGLSIPIRCSGTPWYRINVDSLLSTWRYDPEKVRTIIYKEENEIIKEKSSQTYYNYYVLFNSSEVSEDTTCEIIAQGENKVWDKTESKYITEETTQHILGTGVGYFNLQNHSGESLTSINSGLYQYVPYNCESVEVFRETAYCIAFSNFTQDKGDEGYGQWALSNCLITGNKEFAVEYLQTGKIPEDVEVIDPTGDPVEDADNDGKEEDKEDATPPNTPSESVFVNGMCNYYALTGNNVETFANWFWYGMLDVTDTIINKVTKMFDGLAQNVIGLKLYPFNVSSGGPTSKIVVGRMNCGLQAPSVDTTVRYTAAEFTFKSPNAKNFYGYEPYTTCKIFLPFVGLREFNLNVWSGKKCTVQYVADLRSGKGTAELWRGDSLIEQFDCTLGIDIPISLEDGRSICNNIIDYAMSFVPDKSIVGDLSFSSSVDSAHSIGSANGFTYLYSPFDVFILCESPVAYHTRKTFDTQLGRLTKKAFKLSTLKGFTQCSNVRIKFDKACKPTHQEIQEIYTLLESGINLDK